KEIIVDLNSNLSELEIKHCTLIPYDINLIKQTSLIIQSELINVSIEHSILGALEVSEGASVQIRDSIIDARANSNIAYSLRNNASFGGALTIENSTVIGKVLTRKLELASNCIFSASIITKQKQEGCIRFSYYLQEGSSVPRPFNCQPHLSGNLQHIRPSFTSLRLGDAGYCQLSEFCVSEIAAGADDESEMGVFHHLYQPQKIANLRTRLDEYLRFGLEAGIFYAS
ncbi:MAG: hypothetical protein AAFP82_20800, partial [Bacteroidota bacterium]